MKKCDYLILEYADSELRAHGIPFIVILRGQDNNSCVLTGYVLRGWETKIRVASDKELEDVGIILEDLRYYSRVAPSSSGGRFFDRLASLNVGPVRERVSGSCHLEELDTVLPIFFEGEIVTVPWQLFFDEVAAVAGSVA